jgi:hypothetical protein
MEEKNVGLTRREFAKTVGVGTAVATLALPVIAGAAGDEYRDVKKGAREFAFVTKTPFPKLLDGCAVIYGEKTARLYKNKINLTADRYLELNGMAAEVVQMCNGGIPFEQVVDTLAHFHESSVGQVEPGVFGFLRYLFEEGYVCFVSEKFWTRKKRGGGLRMLDCDEKNIRIVAGSEGGAGLSF